MKVNNVELNDKLEMEIHIGEKASKAYALWVSDYIRTQQKALFEEFKQVNFHAYGNIQARISAMVAIEQAIKQDIQTGELAKKQLRGA